MAATRISDTTSSQVTPSSITQGLESKFNPPATDTSQVARAGLSEMICRGAGQLVLIRAPAGFGKTTAMLQARVRLEDAGVATAWLTLDRADNDVSRFLSCLETAVRQLGLPGNDTVQALSQSDAPFALFLDEFEAIHETSLMSIVREIAYNLPRQGLLVIGSRSLPQIGLARLRVRGQLIEMETEHLRFSLRDTARFFEQRPQPYKLSADQLFRLHEKTEGWVAALWLAAMALDGSVNPEDFLARFSGSNRAVADYLAEDVLARQPASIRKFLLRTSILRQLDTSVCAALNPNLDCTAILQQLDADHLFLTPVASELPKWRYHSLFADHLRQQLQQEFPHEVARLHLAASGWYESQGRPVPAIDHAIEGGDFPLAMQLLEQNAEDFLEQGRMRMLYRWCNSLPPSDLQQHPRLVMVAIWATSFTHGSLSAIDRLEQQEICGIQDERFQQDAMCVRPLLLAMQDRREEAIAAGHKALNCLPGKHDFAITTLLNVMAHTTSMTGQPQQALRLLDAAKKQHGNNSTFNRMYSESTGGLLDLQKGRLRQASARFRLAVDATRAVNLLHTHGNAWAGVLYASIVYEANRLDEADHLLNVYLPVARDVGLPDHMILSHAMRSRIAFVQGDVDAAWLSLTELEYLGHQRKLPRVVATAKLERARLLSLQGHGTAAQDELDRADDPNVWQLEKNQRLLANDIEYMALARIRWEIAFGDPTQALRNIEAELKSAEAAIRQRRVLSLRLLRALAFQRLGETHDALTTLGIALHWACQEGFMRQVLDEGQALGSLVHRYQTQHDNSAVRDPLMGDYLQRLLQAFGPLPLDLDKIPGPAQGPLEPLTRKELRVLQLLVEGYSNSAMAEKLFVSDSTVRTHLRNINMKLDAHSRTQAVAIARRMGLIS